VLESCFRLDVDAVNLKIRTARAASHRPVLRFHYLFVHVINERSAAKLRAPWLSILHDGR
jgi:hypothetical protein